MKSHKEFKSSLTELGERIYHRRVIKKLPVKEIASRVSLTPEAFRNIEKGESDPSFTTVLLIAKTLDLSCQDLIKGL